MVFQRAIDTNQYNHELASRKARLKTAKKELKKYHTKIQQLTIRNDIEKNKRNSRRMAFKRPRTDCKGCTALDTTLDINFDTTFGCYECKDKPTRKKLDFWQCQVKKAICILEKFKRDFRPLEDSDTSTVTPTDSI